MIKRSTSGVDLADIMQKISVARNISKLLLMKLWFLVFEGVFSFGNSPNNKTAAFPVIHRNDLKIHK